MRFNACSKCSLAEALRPAFESSNPAWYCLSAFRINSSTGSGRVSGEEIGRLCSPVASPTCATTASEELCGAGAAGLTGGIVVGSDGAAAEGFFAVWQPRAAKSSTKLTKVGENEYLILIVFYNLRSDRALFPRRDMKSYYPGF